MELQVADLSVARGGVPVLEGVGFTLRGGEALILRGPNGSGKTTLLRTLAGLQPPLDGTISIPPEAAAYAGHADGIKPTLTVAENLRFWAAIYGTHGIDTALEAFDLVALHTRPAQNLSAGQKRRLGLARLAVTGRPLWMLDEPTVSLDTVSVARFGTALQAHLSAGGAALIATHIDLGIEARELDVTPFRAKPRAGTGAFDEAFA
ncbi:MAG: heme ABC exporter ATP-binding protein CcmA [Pseudomonadota bacterium]